MKQLLTLTFFALCILISLQTIGQVDTNALKTFVLKQKPNEKKFIKLLKRNKIDSCLKFFSSSVISKYGTDSLRKELKRLNKLLMNYPTPVNSLSLGQSSVGVGGFGHDNSGNFELQSLYQFMDKGKVVYFFTLYFSDKEPVDIIKYYDSESFTDVPLLKPIKTSPTKTP